MSIPLWSAIALGVAVWCALGDPARGLRSGRRGLAAPAFVRGRPGGASPALRLRAGVAVWASVALLAGAGRGLPLGLLAGLMVSIGLGWLEPAGRRLEARRLARELPEALELMAATLEAGAPLRVATAEVATVAPEAAARCLHAVVAQTRIGVGDTEAWRSQQSEPGWGPIARDLARSAETGAAAADVLRHHARDARTQRRQSQLAAARAVGVRSVLPLMTCFLPAFLLTGVVPIVAGLAGGLLQR